MSPDETLPIEAHLGGIVDALGRHGSGVLVAEPGAGKTSRVPLALLAARPAGQIWVLQPRRLAARLAAARAARALGERVGGTVGHRVRFDERVGPRTRLIFMTEASLLRALLSDRQLGRVACVIFDEFHERSLAADLGLAVVRRLQATSRPDLQLLVMSATLDAAQVGDFLATPWRLQVAGRQHPVEIGYLPRRDPAPVGAQVLRAVGALTAAGSRGDILVFLAGMQQILQVQRVLRPALAGRAFDVAILHGALSAREQDLAIARGPRPKVVLATNVAQTSITLEDVGAVIDGGWARQAEHAPDRGIDSLVLRPISQAAADQRAGRAGRRRPGRCLRLWTHHDHARRPLHDVPEILRCDLSMAALWLAAAGQPELEDLPLLTAPPPQSVASARALLRALGAAGADGQLTARGRAMAQLPLHPRLARLVLAAEDLGVGPWGCALAAAMGEGDRPPAGGPAAPAAADSRPLASSHDLVARLPQQAAAPAVCQVLAQLLRLRRLPGQSAAALVASRREGDEARISRATLAAFPDRVAAAVPGQPGLYLTCAGQRLQLSVGSAAAGADMLVALAVEAAPAGARRPGRVSCAAAIAADWLLDLSPAVVTESCERAFDPAGERVVEVSALRCGAIVLSESRRPVADAALLGQAARKAGIERFVDVAAWAALAARCRLLAGLRPDLPAPQLDAASLLAGALAQLGDARSFACLRREDLLARAAGSWAPELRGALAAVAPTHLTLASGRRVAVIYAPGQPPAVAAPLQDFFGQAQSPTLGSARLPLTLQLLAPNRRPVQITSDLASFWQNHYPALRRALRSRYPRHLWPEDPRRAAPPAAGARRPR